MASRHELPKPGSPEEAKEFATESERLHAFLDHILAKQPWSGWKRLKDPNEPYAFHEVVLPSYKFRYRSLKTTVDVPVRFEVTSDYMLHDSEDGEAKLDLLVSEHQIASVGGILRNPRINTRRFEFLIEGRHDDYKYPEREPKPLTEEARRYGVGDYSFRWKPKAMQPSHRLVYDPSGRLVEASVAFNANPLDSPIYASNWFRYSKDDKDFRAGLMATQNINQLLEKAFPSPYRSKPSKLGSGQDK